MHHGVFRGDKADHIQKKVLILGESHRTNTADELNKDPGQPATYTSKGVVNDYIAIGSRNKKSYRFFSNIAHSFGFPTDTVEGRRMFWELVYFGNYADVLGNVGTAYIKDHISNTRPYQNDSLFTFVNANQIDYVFCFSRLVYGKLPPVSEGEKEERIPDIISKSNYLRRTIYLPNKTHSNCSVELKKELTVYGLHHASRYFSSAAYKDYLSGLQLF